MYNTVRFSDIIPQFSTYVPGLEPAACVEDATTVGAQTEVLAATAGVKTVVPSFVARCRYDDNYFGDISLTPLVPSQMAPEELLPIITHINQILYEAYDPYSFYNFLDNVLDFVTGSLYSFLVNRVFGSYCRRKLSALEDYIDSVNSKFVSESRDIKFISPRRCGYLSIDIQIPKPVGGKSSSKI